jgi:ribokinase
LKVAFNPAPMTAGVRGYPLELVDLFILNETEAEGLTGAAGPEAAASATLKRYPGSAVVVTLGEQGAVYAAARGLLREPALAVKAVDTTAAGDTFTGFFLAEMMRSGGPATALALGCRAAGICVTRPGASDSIPTLEEVGSPARRDDGQRLRKGAQPP